MRNLRIAQVGAFDFENYGDLLFVDVLGRHLGKRLDCIDITLFSPIGGELPNSNMFVYRVDEMEEMHSESPFDAIVIGGGDLIHFQRIITHVKRCGGATIYDVASMWVVPILLSWKYNIPIFWNAPGVPLPFEGAQRDLCLALCMQSDYVSVRDANAAKELINAGVSSDVVNIVPDSVLSIATLFDEGELAASFPHEDKLIPGKYLFFQCNTSFSDEEIAACADLLLEVKRESGLQVLLSPIGYGLEDQKALDKIDELHPNEFIRLNDDFNQYRILSLIANSACYMGSSLHGCITANAFNRPNLVLNRNLYNKTDGLMRLLNRTERQVVDLVSELPEKKSLLFVEPGSLPQHVLDRIDNHFDTIAANIKRGYRPKSVRLASSICDYIYASGEERRVREVQEGAIRSNLEKKICNLERELFEMKESSSWRITAPFRAIKSRLNSFASSF